MNRKIEECEVSIETLRQNCARLTVDLFRREGFNRDCFGAGRPVLLPAAHHVSFGGKSQGEEEG